MFEPGQIIDLTPRDREALGVEVCEMILDLERTYTPLFEDLATWWEWYDAVPVSEVKNWPFRGSSNLVVPLIAVMCDGMVARLYGALFGTGKRVWTTFTENEQMERLAKGVGRHMNWAARNDFNIRLPVYDWLTEVMPIGTSVIAGSWRRDIRPVFFRQGRGSARKILSQQVEFGRGPLFEHIPREQVLWDTQHQISEAPLVVREFHHTWSTLNHLASTNPGWDRSALEELRRSDGIDSPSRRVTRQKEERESRTAGATASGSGPREHDVRQAWITWPTVQALGLEKAVLSTSGASARWRPGDEEEGTPSIPMLATVHRRSRKLLQLKAAPYFWPGHPFFAAYIRKRAGRGHAVGLAKRLEHLQLGITTAVNQSLDSRTRANAFWGVTTSPKVAKQEIDPSHMFKVDSMDSFREAKITTNVFEDLSLVTVLRTFAELLVGMSDPAFGRETRQGGHPSPATSTVFLAQQGVAQTLPTRELLRMEMARMGQFAATLYQQFEADEDGRLRRVFGDRDAQQLEEWLYPDAPIVGNIEFDVASMSQSHSPDAEMNRAIQVTQMNTNYWGFVLRVAAALQQAPQNPIIVAAATKALQAQTQAHIQFLEAADVDDIERMVLELQRGQELEAAQLQRLAGQLGEVAAARGAVGEPGVGRPNGSTLGGAGALQGPFGVQ